MFESWIWASLGIRGKLATTRLKVSFQYGASLLCLSPDRQHIEDREFLCSQYYRSCILSPNLLCGQPLVANIWSMFLHPIHTDIFGHARNNNPPRFLSQSDARPIETRIRHGLSRKDFLITPMPRKYNTIHLRNRNIFYHSTSYFLLLRKPN